MNRKRVLALLFAASLLVTMAVVFLLQSDDPRMDVTAGGVAELAEGDQPQVAGSRERRGASPRRAEEDDELEQKLVMMLLHLYGDRISSTSVQILMAQIRTQVMTLFPGDWSSRFRRILEAAFPGYSAQILATLANVDSFDRWLAANDEELAVLTPEEREEAVLAKKEELFGEQAVEELEAEARASQQREQAMGETIRSLEESDDTTLDEKLDVFKDALHENLGDGPAALALENGSVLAQAFFGLDSVSRQLAALDPAARQERINDIRREFGYDEEQIAELEKDDREREADWQNGFKYMDERRSLESSYSGAQLEQQLASLRQRYFGDEARTIELEERDGFFRFERPRLYGRN
ncbi:MAG: hypothetical protein HY899_12100 [Deltaproteobacteria bacterium]|nr:hypothetical protein [Deltaproteobacteria bacterium]